MLKRLKKSLAISILGAAAFAGNATAAVPLYSDVVIFGDSVSDTGNVLALTGGAFPSFTGGVGRFSNGPVWTEYLAAELQGGQFAGKANPSYRYLTGALTAPPNGLPAGNNYSFGGARTLADGAAGLGTGLMSQLTAWSSAPSVLGQADPNALYVLMAGANDLRDIRLANFATDQAGIDARAAGAGIVAGNIKTAMEALASAGARNFLISSLPDLGKTPEALLLELDTAGAGANPRPGLVAASTDVTTSFNAALAANAAMLNAQFGGVLDIRTLDFFGLVNNVFNDTAAFGITNVSSACIVPVNVGIPGAEYFNPLAANATGTNCVGAAFSDPLHPSARSHELLSALAVAAVPEPSEFALFGAGLLLIAGMRRRTLNLTRRAQAA